MQFLRFATVLLLVFSLAPVVVADDPPKEPERSGDWGLAQLQDEISALRLRIQQLAEDAKKDPRDLALQRYKGFTADDFKEKKREPRVKEMLEWLFDEACPFDLRQEVVETLGKSTFKDPDLDSTRKGSRQSPRAKLSPKIVAELDSKERKARGLAAALLEKLWGRPPDPAIRAYRPEERHKKTWDDAEKAWTKFLRSR